MDQQFILLKVKIRGEANWNFYFTTVDALDDPHQDDEDNIEACEEVTRCTAEQAASLKDQIETVINFPKK
ncbi:MAG TPA: hypothetical protein VEA58_03800 [Anaerovoracaceae bacterium]|nr:hypothetical protein [Anaerovoracaceae bacterium]